MAQLRIVRKQNQRFTILLDRKRRLAALSGMSLSTVNRRLREPEKAGYITAKKELAHFDWDKGRLSRKASVYICHVPETGYLLVPYQLLRRLCGLGIHGALKVLEAVGLLYIDRCLKRNGAYSCYSYWLLHDTLNRLRPTCFCTVSPEQWPEVRRN